jgi:hypothetical protein
MLDARDAARARRDLECAPSNDKCDAPPVPVTRTSQRTARTFNTAHVPTGNLWCRLHRRPSKLCTLPCVAAFFWLAPLEVLPGVDPPPSPCSASEAVRRGVAPRRASFFFGPCRNRAYSNVYSSGARSVSAFGREPKDACPRVVVWERLQPRLPCVAHRVRIGAGQGVVARRRRRPPCVQRGQPRRGSLSWSLRRLKCPRRWQEAWREPGCPGRIQGKGSHGNATDRRRNHRLVDRMKSVQA